jgi:hypothetical protein
MHAMDVQRRLLLLWHPVGAGIAGFLGTVPCFGMQLRPQVSNLCPQVDNLPGHCCIEGSKGLGEISRRHRVLIAVSKLLLLPFSATPKSRSIDDVDCDNQQYKLDGRRPPHC